MTNCCFLRPVNWGEKNSHKAVHKKLSRVLVSVPDVDECVENPAACSGHSVCENTLGGYKCVCAAGYRGNGTHCEGKQTSCDVPAREKILVPDVMCVCVCFQMRMSARRASTAATPTPAVATSSARTSASVTKASTETDALVSVGCRGRVLSSLVYRPTAEVHTVVPTLEDVLEDCPPSQTSTSAPSTTATASTTASMRREASTASAPPVTSWTRTDAAAQVQHNWRRYSVAGTDSYTTGQKFFFHLFIFFFLI